MKKMALSVFSQKGDKLSDFPLDEKIFDGRVNVSLLHQVVRMYQNQQRQGTHGTKTRGEVSGGGKKPWRQKGTGRARAGSNRSPLWRHGGTVFGPKPRDYGFVLPKRVRRSAVRQSLNAKVKGGELVLIESLKVDRPKTKTVAELLKILELRGSVLLVVEKMNEPLKLSCRNLPGVSLKTHRDVNAYDLLHHPNILMEKNSFAHFLESLSKKETS